eukprot:Nitzschia sp. Nitz4//scaffold157_size52427//42637//44838//NITZ4_006847-RA/size52427-processed-gene-0.27-mRNA-1//1//CDS//3329537476//5546//frame0
MMATTEDEEALELTIDRMTQPDGGCFDPRHGHSFRAVSFLLPLHVCAICSQRLQALSPFSTSPVVQCIACSLIAHRNCALSPTTHWSDVCPVNHPTLVPTGSLDQGSEENHLNIDDVNDTNDESSLENSPPATTSTRDDETSQALTETYTETASPIGQPDPFAEATSEGTEAMDPVSFEWTAEGPPTHWAAGQSFEGVLPHKYPTQEGGGNKDDFQDGAESEQVQVPLHYSTHPFASVSRALHDNIVVHFTGKWSENQDGDVCPIASSSPNAPTIDPTPDLSGLPSPDSTVSNNKPLHKSQSFQKPLSLAAVAGGIAGGVAGLAVAGPVGGVVAALGQSAGLLGVVLEGSVAIGVVSSGIAAGGHYGQHIQEKLDEKRVLALGEDNRLLLVRPTVRTDPIWLELYDAARQSHNRGLPFRLLPSDSLSRDRYERKSDIVTTGEDEIPTKDKVLLLASRVLNNKESLPGHVFRQLIECLRERASERGLLDEIVLQRDEQKSTSVPEDLEIDATTVGERDLICARRQDAHAVIKFVTATLLEVRQEFASSSSMTELTASAVEGLVFGQIYDLVMEEIETDLRDCDNSLLEKIECFEQETKQSCYGTAGHKESISEEALDALRQLPEAHSAADKLHYCVIFLEKISEFFARSTNDESGKKGPKALGADSLLKLVCHHILVAKVMSINAQIAFLDDFAQDKQLLRGREGYALITMQASLHFLNASDNLIADIFEQDDD